MASDFFEPTDHEEEEPETEGATGEQDGCNHLDTPFWFFQAGFQIVFHMRYFISNTFTNRRL